jgi:ABC-type phosphate transport system substrate-binding protein
MTRLRTSHGRLLLRVLVYILVIVVLYQVRGGGNWRHLIRQLPGLTPADSTLIVAGEDLAPALVQQLAASYHQDYPRPDIRVREGGTNQALEDLINGHADAAFLIHPPTSAEQQLFRAAHGDTATWYPIALGGIVLLRGQGTAATSLTLEDLRRSLQDSAASGFDHLYVPDPNTGLWEVFLAALGMPSAEEPAPARVIFLMDEPAVFAALQEDRRSLGLASTFTLPADIGARGLEIVPIQPEPGGKPVFPDTEALAFGDYPLWHYLYVCCRGHGSSTVAMFVTYVTSDRGQRRIERAGYLPVRWVLREIHLTRQPMGT